MKKIIVLFYNPPSDRISTAEKLVELIQAIKSFPDPVLPLALQTGFNFFNADEKKCKTATTLVTEAIKEKIIQPLYPGHYGTIHHLLSATDITTDLNESLKNAGNTGLSDRFENADPIIAPECMDLSRKSSVKAYNKFKHLLFSLYREADTGFDQALFISNDEYFRLPVHHFIKRGFSHKQKLKKFIKTCPNAVVYINMANAETAKQLLSMYKTLKNMLQQNKDITVTHPTRLRDDDFLTLDVPLTGIFCPLKGVSPTSRITHTSVRREDSQFLPRTNLTSDMQGETALYNNNQKIYFHDGILSSIAGHKNPVNILPASKPFIETEKHGHLAYNTVSAFSTENDTLWGLRSYLELNHSALESKGILQVDHSFAPDYPFCIVRLDHTYPVFKKDTAINKYATLRVPVCTYGKDSALEIVVRQGNKVTTHFSTQAPVTNILSGSLFSFKVESVTFFIYFPDGDKTGPHVIHYSITSRGKYQQLDVTINGSVAQIHSSDLNGCKEQTRFVIGTTESEFKPSILKKRRLAQFL